MTREYKPKKWLFNVQYPGEHYSARSAQTIFKDAYKKLNLPSTASVHSLRHSYAIHLLENGILPIYKNYWGIMI